MSKSNLQKLFQQFRGAGTSIKDKQRSERLAKAEHNTKVAGMGSDWCDEAHHGCIWHWQEIHVHLEELCTMGSNEDFKSEGQQHNIKTDV